MKLLFLDIETSPIEAYTWGLWDQNISLNQIIKPTEMISFAAKFKGDKKKHFHSVFHDGKEAMVQAAHALVDECDVLGTWNGRKFDEKHLRREFVEAGLTPPSPYKSLDLLLTARSQFYFPSNKLQYVSTALGLEGKVSHTGFDLWLKCMAGDAKAWAVMKRYNIQDVLLLEELHEALLPWIKGHPHHALYALDDDTCCQNCGSRDLQRRGYDTTSLGKYPRFQCKDCGKWGRGKKSVASVDVRGIQ